MNGADSGGTSSSSFHKFTAGMRMYSAKQPSVSTPMIWPRSQMWALPVRQ